MTSGVKMPSEEEALYAEAMTEDVVEIRCARVALSKVNDLPVLAKGYLPIKRSDVVVHGLQQVDDWFRPLSQLIQFQNLKVIDVESIRCQRSNKLSKSVYLPS
jgi:hypothetical protein